MLNSEITPEQAASYSPTYQTFCEDMSAAGYPTIHYRGRFYYEGPAVIAPYNELQEVIRATSVPLQWDDMGKSDAVIYPRN